mmetsp:Transcript_58147/g.52372  ORF Transcript_58147/g.52372 Transcript_58147/m.52372 type:complete len:712 (-) Transcript_58147:23-2158(-)|eukprot:CAMPEP_0201582436 /NCGR_PEP_ID=MMETSP0190_2-20130828/85097_1 /ASSEMBLY_ACC=CAM_ASM_000263 /TAXON_ID=37353 /ORGANISM="Rosalina sp." /LENGTH=711 /DNA_ID=CAMNT_0048022325 /DNA_START=97 /DNA_END=2232 /DNA_ORIENTATION=-
MGAFCTKTICNVEKGDDNYNKLLNRNINMEKKKPEFESLPSRDVPDNDEQEIPRTPESPDEPKPAYTHSTPNSSMTMTAISQSQQSRSVSTNQSTPPSTLENNGNYATDMIGTPTSKHMQVPTPSLQEIQAAMENMSVMFTPQSPLETDQLDGNDTKVTSKYEKKQEQTPTLPTMADHVSNLHLTLANPFASPVVSDNPPSSFPAMPSIPSHQSIPSGQSINAGMPTSPIRMAENISTISESLLGPSSPINVNQQLKTMSPQSQNNNVNMSMNMNINPNAQETTDIAEAAFVPIEPAPITPTLANIFGGQGNGTIVIHGSDDESPALTGKLTLQLEGSSDQRDDTNVVFSPPNISDDKVEEEEDEDDTNKVNNMNNNSLQKDQKGADDKNVPKSEILPPIPQREVPADDNNNDDQSNDIDKNDTANNDNDNGITNISENDNAEIKEETVTFKFSEVSRDNDTSNNVNVDASTNDRENDNNSNTKADVDIKKEIANVDQDRKDVDESEQPKQYSVNIIEPKQQQEQEAPAVLASIDNINSNASASSMNTRLSATNSNQSEENEIEQEKRIDGNQQVKMMQMTDPWKSDYETSDLESCDSLDKGEDDGDVDGKKRRQSKTEDLSHLEAQHHLALNYEDTTLNDESTTDDEESPRPGDHSKLYREHSRWKWQNKDINKHQRAMTQQLEKLQAEQEVAEMHNMMQFYRQQSEQLQ